MYIRLDTLQEVNPEPSTLLWGAGPPGSDINPSNWAIKVKKAHLFRQWSAGRSAFLSISAGWAVRLVEASTHKGRQARIAHLMKRDGPTCLYCGDEIDPRACTVEHIVPASAGGPEHASNLALSCRPCNAAMGHLSAVEKVKLAIRFRVGRCILESSGRVVRGPGD